MKKTIKAIATIAVLALTGCTQADDAAAHMGELVSYDIQSGTIRLDGGVQA